MYSSAKLMIRKKMNQLRWRKLMNQNKEFTQE